MTSVHRQGGRLDPHDVLGVPRGADREHVIRAFHHRARRGGHPDTGGDAQTFEEIVRARDVLLDQARLGARRSDRRAAQTVPAARRSGPNANPRPAYVSPKVATRQAGPTEQGGGSVVPFFLLILFVFTLPVLLRILSLVLIP